MKSLIQGCNPLLTSKRVGKYSGMKGSLKSEYLRGSTSERLALGVRNA